MHELDHNEAPVVGPLNRKKGHGHRTQAKFLEGWFAVSK